MIGHKVKLDYETQTLAIGKQHVILRDINEKQSKLQLGLTKEKGFIEPRSVAFIRVSI